MHVHFSVRQLDSYLSSGFRVANMVVKRLADLFFQANWFNIVMGVQIHSSLLKLIAGTSYFSPFYFIHGYKYSY